jgi:benzoylformate decarboxylase
VAIGCQLFGQELYVAEPLLARHTKVIQIDDDPWEIAKNFPVSVGIQGNIRVSVSELIDLLEKTMSVPEKEAARDRVSDITRETDGIKAAFLKQAEAKISNTSISNEHLILALRDTIKPGTIVLDDCWSTSAVLRRVLNFSEPGSFQRCRGGGSIGEGIPSAIGVKLAAPERPVVAVCGDGSAVWSIQGLWTAAHYNLPITFIVVHNTSYQTVKNFWTLLLGGKPSDRHVGMEMDEPVIDFCKMAESMNVHGEMVNRPEELGKVIKNPTSRILLKCALSKNIMSEVF